MSHEIAVQNASTEIQNATTNEDIRLRLQNFTANINKAPKHESLGDTPDKKAKTVIISHIEMTLDEYFFGLWQTKNFTTKQIGNEIVGEIELHVFHPVANTWITRIGAASIVIMVDKAPEGVVGAERNTWALNMENKKSNALDMGYPKLKAECLKNAANSLGALFGRDLNRKEKDVYNPLIKQKYTPTKPAENE